MPLKLADVRGESFFGDPALDANLPAANEAFWASLIGIIDGDAPSAPRAILDVGCHSGGLLDALTRRFVPAQVFGIEPLAWARVAASRRLANVVAAVMLLDVSQWDQVPAGAIDLVTSHEVLYLEPDVPGFMREVRRVLAVDGRAYVVLGCHAENPLWRVWKSRLTAAGRTVYDHIPLDIMEAAAAAGLSLPCSRFDVPAGSPTIRVEQSSPIPTSGPCSTITIDTSWCFACAWPTVMRQLPESTIETSLKRAIDSRARQFASVRDAERAALSGTLVDGLDRHHGWPALCDTVNATVRRHGFVVIRGLEADVGHPQELIISRHSSTDPVDDDAVAGRRHGWGLSGDGVCAAAG